MTHIDPGDLALIALAEFDLTEEERGHLAECPNCALDLISLQHTAAVGRSARLVRLTDPAASVWAGLHSALDLTSVTSAPPRLGDYLRQADAAGAADDVADLLEGDTGLPTAVPLPAIAPAADAPAAKATVSKTPALGSAGSGAAASGPPTVLRPRRRVRARTWVPILAAAAASIVLLVAGFGAGRWFDALRQPAAPPVTLQAQLTPFPGWQASGSAEVEALPGGHREVVVDLAGLAGATAAAPLREVWLIKADASGLISIGLLDGNTGTFDIPDGVDLAQYPLVDVSAEPNDGNPAHSGNSIVRGELHAS